MKAMIIRTRSCRHLLRRGSLTMALLWITMSTGFTNVMAGFQWHKGGFNLTQVLQASLFSFLLIMAYGIPACYLGCKSGLTWAVLSRRIFGHWGSQLVSFNLIWVNIGWYALNAVYLGECFRGLFHWTVPIVILARCLPCSWPLITFLASPVLPTLPAGLPALC